MGNANITKKIMNKKLTTDLLKSRVDSPTLVRVQHRNLASMVESEIAVANELLQLIGDDNDNKNNKTNSDINPEQIREEARNIYIRLYQEVPDVAKIARFWEGLSETIDSKMIADIASVLIQAHDFIGPNRKISSSSSQDQTNDVQEWRYLSKLQSELLKKIAIGASRSDYLQ